MVTNAGAWLAALFAAAITTQVPSTVGQTAAGTSITLPEALHGRTAVLLVGFSKQGGEETGRWEAKLLTGHSPTTTVDVLRVAMLETVPKMLRMFARRNIQSGIRPDRRDTFVLVFQNEPAWKEFVHFNEPNDAYVVLVAPTGDAVWSTHGKADSAAYAALQAQIRLMSGS